jgi:uncharacterized membrane protein YjjB (DUF3815 family)
MGQAVKIIITGIFLWLIALIIEIARSAPSSQIWICIVGALLGLLGLRYTIRRKRREN